MKTITIICDDEVSDNILNLISPLPIEKLVVEQKRRRKRRTVSHGQRQHAAVDDPHFQRGN